MIRVSNVDQLYYILYGQLWITQLPGRPWISNVRLIRVTEKVKFEWDWEGQTIDLVVEVRFGIPGKAICDSTVISPHSMGSTLRLLTALCEIVGKKVCWIHSFLSRRLFVQLNVVSLWIFRGFFFLINNFKEKKEKVFFFSFMWNIVSPLIKYSQHQNYSPKIII